MSVEISYKSGKPMLINNEDVTTLSEVDPCIISVPRDLFLNPDYERNAPKLIENLKREGAVFYFAHFLLMLTRIKAKVTTNCTQDSLQVSIHKGPLLSLTKSTTI